MGKVPDGDAQKIVFHQIVKNGGEGMSDVGTTKSCMRGEEQKILDFQKKKRKKI